MESCLGVGYSGEDNMVGLEFEFIKLYSAQQQPETTAIIALLHGLHGSEHLIRGERDICAF
jgi:hypothetical protein